MKTTRQVAEDLGYHPSSITITAKKLGLKPAAKAHKHLLWDDAAVRKLETYFAGDRNAPQMMKVPPPTDGIADAALLDSEAAAKALGIHANGLSFFLKKHGITAAYTWGRKSMFTGAQVKEMVAQKTKDVEAHKAAVTENLRRVHEKRAAQTDLPGMPASTPPQRELPPVGLVGQFNEVLTKIAADMDALRNARPTPSPGERAPAQSEPLPNTRLDRIAARQETAHAAIQDLAKRVEVVVGMTRTPPDIKALTELMQGLDLTLAKAEASSAAAARQGAVLAEDFAKENERTRQMLKGLNTRLDTLSERVLGTLGHLGAQIAAMEANFTAALRQPLVGYFPANGTTHQAAVAGGAAIAGDARDTTDGK